MKIFKKWWFWVILVAVILITTKVACAEPAEVHAGVRAYYQSEWNTTVGKEEKPYVFQLDNIRIWMDKNHGNGTKSRLTLEADGNDQLVRFREAYVSKHFLNSPLGVRFGVYENPFGLNQTWDTFGITGKRSPWVGTDGALNRLGIGIPQADAGAGVLLNTKYADFSADIFNGSGYKNLEWNQEKDLDLKAIFKVKGVRCEVGQYKSLDGPTQADPYTWNNFLAAINQGGFTLTGQYITSGDIYGQLLGYSDDDLANRDQVFTVAGEYNFTDEVALAIRGDKYDDGSPDKPDPTNDIEIPVFLQGDITQLSGGVNYYLDGTEKNVLLQLHGVNTNYREGDDSNKLVFQLSWVY